MKATPTAIPDVLLMTPQVFSDERGYFFESYNRDTFREATGLDPVFVQDNHSRSVRGVLRGLHFQLAPHAQGKLVRVVQGEVFDVAVDIRKESPTFGRWTGTVLSADDRRQLWLPPGLAHGFLALSESAVSLYKVTDHHVPGLERCIRWDDPTLAIDWPLQGAPIVSARDAAGMTLAEAMRMA